MNLKTITKKALAPLSLIALLAAPSYAEDMKCFGKIGFFLPQIDEQVTQYEGSLVTEIGAGYEGKDANLILSGSSFSTTGNSSTDRSYGLFSSSSSSRGSSLEIKTLKATLELKLSEENTTPYFILFGAANNVSEVRIQEESRTGLSFGDAHSERIRESKTIPSAGLGLGFERKNKDTSLIVEAAYTSFDNPLLKSGYTLSTGLSIKF